MAFLCAKYPDLPYSILGCNRKITHITMGQGRGEDAKKRKKVAPFTTLLMTIVAWRVMYLPIP